VPARASVPPDQLQRLRELPSVDRLLDHPSAASLFRGRSRARVLREMRRVLDDLRTEIRASDATHEVVLDPAAIIARVGSGLEAASRRGTVPVVNATGTILHTNLGRALLPAQAVAAVQQAAAVPVNLEYDLDLGDRGRREQPIEDLVVALTGAEAATVVNNNAAALLLALHALARGKEVIVSRGELIEIGGSFRLPDILGASGAVLREVGTTNRTHPHDYIDAIGDRTALILKVHTSNFRVVGFVADVPLPDLVRIGRDHNLPLVEDLGSGALVDLASYGLPREPLVADSIAAGVDLVTFSGDKLLGGPQAGLVAGREALIRRMTTDPMHRAVRCGKLTLAALEATLRLYDESPNLIEDLPVLRTLSRPLKELDQAGERALPAIASSLGPGFHLSLTPSSCQVGSGALPTEMVPSRAIAIQHDTMEAGEIARRFRMASPPIIGRVMDGRFLLDLRTVTDPLQLVPHGHPEP
jgi:L-seryl-tRNA(Ser) seleniumtransferase